MIVRNGAIAGILPSKWKLAPLENAQNPAQAINNTELDRQAAEYKQLQVLLDQKEAEIQTLKMENENLRIQVTASSHVAQKVQDEER